MDVRCNRCGTEYELDDARVAHSGTTVKCSSCGHVFKVLPSGQIQSVVAREPAPLRPASNNETPILGSPPAPAHPPVAPAAPAPPGEWMVRKTDGQTFRFRELTTLQKWIVERKVGRDDEISRSAKSWKRLGEIAELTSFFQVVEAAEAAQRAPGFQGQIPTPQMPNIQLSSTPTGTFSAIPIPMPMTAPHVPDPALSQPPITLAPTMRPELAEPSQGNEQSVDELDADDPVLAWQRKRKTTMAALVAVVVVVVVVGIIAVVSGPTKLDPAVQAAAAEALRSDDDARRTSALELLLPHAQHPVAQAWRARLLVARAQALADENRLRDQLSKLDASVVPSNKDGEQLLAEATATIVLLRANDSVPAEVDLAAAAIALAKGDPQALSSDVALAREHAKHHSNEVERAAVDTEARLLLTLAEAHRATDPRDAKESVQKLERFDDGRAHSAAAVVAVGLAAASRTKDAAAPKEVVDAAARLVGRLLDRDGRKDIAQQILAAAAAPVPVAVVETPSPVVEVPVVEVPVVTPPTETPVESYGVLMQKAEKALVSEHSQVAYELLKKAVALRPNVARPWLKLGWAAIDTSRHGEAQRFFKKALDVDGSLSEAQFGLAESLRFGGKKAEALAAYKAYLQMDPAGKEASIAKNAIQQLE